MQFKNNLFQASLVLGCAILAGKANTAELDDVAGRGAVVARMGGVELHAAEVRKLVEAQSPEVKVQVESGTPVLERLIRKELVRRAVLQEARQKEWDKRPEIMQKMDIAREQVVVSTYVNNLARPPADYPSEDEIIIAYRSGKDTYKLPPQYQASQIYVSPSAEINKKAAEAVQARIVDSTEKPRNKTDDSNAPAMKTGEVSTAIRANPDWHIEMKPAKVRELAEVRESIVQTLRWRKAQENEAKYLEDIASRSSIEINQANLAQALDKR